MKTPITPLMMSLFILFVLLVSCDDMQTSLVSFDEFTDERDGQTYATFEIDGKTWMAENLNYKPREPGYLDTEKYGVLYTFNNAVQYCPKGWHLPDTTEWQELRRYFPDDISLCSGEFQAKMSGWVQQNEYGREGTAGIWWTNTEFHDDYALVYLCVIDGVLQRTNYYKTYMVGVRCVKD